MKANMVVLAMACWASACNGGPAVALGEAGAPKSASQVDARTATTPAPVVPADACTLDGFWSFFDAFARSPVIREVYTDASAHSSISPFRIALSDNQWVYVDGELASPGQRLELVEARDGGSIRLGYAVARFGEDDEVVSRHGPSGSYVFRFVDSCWRLVE